MKVILQDNKGFQWVHSDSVWARGFFLDSNENLIKEQDLTTYFDCSDLETFTQKVKEANGIFAVIKRFDDDFFVLAVDRTRMLPLFYTTDSISDRAELLSNQIDESVIPLFLATGFSPRKNTLLKRVFQVQTAEIVVVKNSEIDSFFYFSYATQHLLSLSYSEAKQELYQHFQTTIQRFIKQVEQRQIVISLSGGYDSRFLLAGLKQNGYENIICFTFGKFPNPEQYRSEQVAKRLGYKWFFIEHNEKVCENYLNDKLFQDYYKYSANSSSSFFLMYFFAMKYLTENQLIEKDAIFVTGYSGDLLGGSQLLPIMLQDVDNEYYSNFIYGKMYGLGTLPNQIKEQELNHLQQTLNQTPFVSHTVAEDLILKEKTVKLVINSANIFHFFGYETRLPLFDNDLMDFCKALPFEFRLYKKLYDEVLIENYFQPLNISFETELQSSPSQVKRQVWKEKVKKYLPYFVRKRFINKNDIMNYELFTQPMLKELKNIDCSGQNYNSFVAQWYIYQFLKSKNS